MLNLNIIYNQITSIDLSKNTELLNLHINYNPITSVDLSKNTKLVMFDAYKVNGNLTKLNIDGCDSLEYFYLPKTYQNQLKMI